MKEKSLKKGSDWEKIRLLTVALRPVFLDQIPEKYKKSFTEFIRTVTVEERHGRHCIQHHDFLSWMQTLPETKKKEREVVFGNYNSLGEEKRKKLEKQLNKEIEKIYDRLLTIDKTLFRTTKRIKSFNEFLQNKGAIVSVIRDGVSFKLFNLIRQAAPFPERYWTTILSLSKKSLKRHEQQRKSFKPIYAEKIIEVSEVAKIGLEAFEDFERLKMWLKMPIPALGNNKPIDLLNSSYGKELVTDELNRINYGIFS